MRYPSLATEQYAFMIPITKLPAFRLTLLGDLHFGHPDVK